MTRMLILIVKSKNVFLKRKKHFTLHRFTAHHWVDLATVLFPALIDANKFCTDTLVCSKMLTEDAEVSCDSCLAVTGGVGALLGEEEIIANMVSSRVA